ncbi:MAG: transketolase family protein [Acetivibrionales bacterium]|jgi:transketolase
MKIKLADKNDIEKIDMRDVYCRKIVEMMKEDSRVYALDADLLNSIGLGGFQKELPDRIIDCGIQEANMVGVAAGMSATGLIPFVHTFGVFATRRVYDQVFLSCGFSKWNVKIVGSDPGINAAYNGGTHMPFEDAGIMRNVPNAVILEPTDGTMLENIITQVKDSYGLHYIRLTRRGSRKVYNEGSEFDIGKAAEICDGKDVTIIACGYCVVEAINAAGILKGKGISAKVIDMFTIKPIDKETIVRAAKETGAIVTAENHSIINGLGSAVAEVLGENIPVPLERVGVKDEFGEVGDVEYLAKRFGIKAENIADAALRATSRKK